jgi:hypothetical protein
MSVLLALPLLAVLQAGAAHATAGRSAAKVTRLSTDPYTNALAEHATEVEPDIWAHGHTLVAGFQVGRIATGSADNIGWATSTDGGSTWRHGFMSGITVYAGGKWARASDPVVAYDPKAKVWLASALNNNEAKTKYGISVNRSTNGLTWQKAVQIATSTTGVTYDKPWVTCDATPASPHYGNCYAEWDLPSSNDQIVMSTSTNGGHTWSKPSSPAGDPVGLGGQPLAQPDGTVIVPFYTNSGAIDSFLSTNGGASWSATVPVATPRMRTDAGGIRTMALPSAEESASGKIYVAWEDCRFRAHCASNDIVYSASANGTTWGKVTRVPIDPVTSTADHFLPGFGVDSGTSGASTRIGLYYYFYPQAKCTVSTCKLEVGYISSANGGVSWSKPATVAGPMKLSQCAQAGGAFVGDYIGSAVVSGHAYSAFALAAAPVGGKQYNEAMYTAGGLTASGGTATTTASPAYRRATPTRNRVITRQ